VAEPNPGRTRVTIRWQVRVLGDVSLKIYNAAGQLVKVLADGLVRPGAHVTAWDGSDNRCRRLAAGIYFCTLDNGTRRISRKLVLTE
jgi:flagellar hook assembly protein FlgD